MKKLINKLFNRKYIKKSKMKNYTGTCYFDAKECDKGHMSGYYSTYLKSG